MKDKYESHKMDDDSIHLSQGIRENAAYLDDTLEYIADCREKSLAMTKLEECVMWANKALALHGMKGNNP